MSGETSNDLREENQQAGERTARTSRTALVLWALMILAGLGSFANSFQGTFVFDDVVYVLEPRWIKSDVPPLAFSNAEHRPLMRLSLWANHQISRFNPWSYHAFNLLVHLAAGTVLFSLVRNTLRLPRFRASFRGVEPELFAFGVSLLWVVHPLQTQSVTYIVQRGESMMGLFYLSLLHCVLNMHFARGFKVPLWGVCAICCAFLGTASKQVMVTAPLCAFLYDWVFLSGGPLGALRKRGVLYVLLLIPMCWALGSVFDALSNRVRESNVQRRDTESRVLNSSKEEGRELVDIRSWKPSKKSAGFDFKGYSKWEYFRTQPQIILFYLRLSLWPDQLSIDHQWLPDYNPWRYGGTIFLFVLIGGAGLFALWKQPEFGFLITAFLLILAPTSSFMPINDFAVEHRMYLPLACVVIGVVWLLMQITKWCVDSGHHFPLVMLLLVVIATALGIRTHIRNKDYSSEVAIWKSAVEVNPQNGRAQSNLGKAYDDQKQFDLAMVHYKNAAALAEITNPPPPPAVISTYYREIGRLYHQKSNPESGIDLPALKRAIHWYQKSLVISNGTDGFTWHSLGRIYAILGRIDEAEFALRKAGELEADDPFIQFDLARIAMMKSDYESAIRYARRAKEIDEDFVEARALLGQALLADGQTSESQAEFEALKALVEKKKASDRKSTQ